MAQDELMRALMQNQQSTQQLKGLDEEYARAEALRGTAMPTDMGKSGYISPLQMLASATAQTHGKQQMDELDPQRSALRQTLAQAQGTEKQNTLKMAMAEAARKQQGTDANTSLAATQAQGAENAAGRLAEEIRMNNQLGDVKMFLTPDNEEGVYRPNPKNNGRYENAAGEPLPSGSKEIFQLKGGRSFSTGDKDDLNDQATMLVELRDLNDTFTLDHIQPTGLPTGLANKIASSLANQDLLKFMNPDMDEKTKASLRWWAKWKRVYELGTRHDLFGATLTLGEAKSWEEAMGMIKGMNPKEAKANMEAITKEAHDKFGNRLGIQWAGTRREDNRSALAFAGKTANFTLSDTEEWTYNWTPEGAEAVPGADPIVPGAAPGEVVEPEPLTTLEASHVKNAAEQAEILAMPAPERAAFNQHLLRLQKKEEARVKNLPRTLGMAGSL